MKRYHPPEDFTSDEFTSEKKARPRRYIEILFDPASTGWQCLIALIISIVKNTEGEAVYGVVPDYNSTPDDVKTFLVNNRWHNVIHETFVDNPGWMKGRLQQLSKKISYCPMMNAWFSNIIKELQRLWQEEMA